MMQLVSTTLAAAGARVPSLTRMDSTLLGLINRRNDRPWVSANDTPVTANSTLPNTATRGLMKASSQGNGSRYKGANIKLAINSPNTTPPDRVSSRSGGIWRTWFSMRR